MAKHIRGDNISISWLRASNYLLQQNKFECYNLLVEINNPIVEEKAVNVDLNSIFRLHNMQSIETIANTIFPYELYKNSNGKDDLYEIYNGLYPMLKKSHPGNRRDTYFNRLINWPLGNGKFYNQIDSIIDKLKKQFVTQNPKRSIYELLITHPYLEATIYTPGNDNSILGFPCLSFLSFKLEERKLNLTALYRNHYYIERAYGNYLGIARLQHFVSMEVGCSIGNLCVLSTHAEIDHGQGKPSITCIKELIEKYGDLIA